MSHKLNSQTRMQQLCTLITIKVHKAVPPLLPVLLLLLLRTLVLQATSMIYNDLLENKQKLFHVENEESMRNTARGKCKQESDSDVNSEIKI